MFQVQQLPQSVDSPDINILVNQLLPIMYVYK